jgi:hypothetical protein
LLLRGILNLFVPVSYFNQATEAKNRLYSGGSLDFVLEGKPIVRWGRKATGLKSAKRKAQSAKFKRKA